MSKSEQLRYKFLLWQGTISNALVAIRRQNRSIVGKNNYVEERPVCEQFAESYHVHKPWGEYPASRRPVLMRCQGVPFLQEAVHVVPQERMNAVLAHKSIQPPKHLKVSCTLLVSFGVACAQLCSLQGVLPPVEYKQDWGL